MTATETITKPTKAHHHHVKLMGCSFVLTAVSANPQKAWDSLRAGVAEIERIEALISSWQPNSETSKINDNAGIEAVKVSSELFGLIERSLQVSKMTAGAFDISGTLSRYYWEFDGLENQLLPEEKIHELRDLINYKWIELDQNESSVFLKKKGMKIGFGGIGKGYAAHRAHLIMKSMGIENGLINASGDLMAWGNPPNRNGWEIKIPDPENRTNTLVQFTIPNGSVVSSGNFENYTLIDGVRYSHIIDPRTGMPIIKTKSVSVICPNPELGDALATAISVLGAEMGINLINRLNGIECMVIDSNNKIHYSTHLNSFQICKN